MATNLAFLGLEELSEERLLEQAYAALCRGDATLASTSYRRILRNNPIHVVALANLGALHCQCGDLAEGIDLLETALSLHPADAHARQNLVNAYACRMSECLRTGDYRGTVKYSRRLLELDRKFEGALINLVHGLHFSGERARLEDFAPELRQTKIGRKILVACMPKSGSTWLISALESLTGFPHRRLSFAFLQNEQEIHLPLLIEYAAQDCVTQQHCRATAANVQLLQAFGIAPIVLVRNIFDALVSMADFWAGGAAGNTFLGADFAIMDRSGQIDAVIDHMAGWYVQFYVSWAIAADERRLPVHWLSYEAMMADKEAALESISRFHGLDKSGEAIAAVIAALNQNRGATRFNKGIPGRGARKMTEGQIARIRNLAKYYPSIDLARIGL